MRRRGAGEPGGDVDQLGAQGRGGRLGVDGGGERAGGAGEVERDRGQHQPGGVGGEPPGRQVRQRPAFRSAMTCSTIACRRWSASASSIGSGLSVNTAWWRQAANSSPCRRGTWSGLSVADPAHDQPGGDVLGLAAGGERGERHLGDLGVGRPTAAAARRRPRAGSGSASTPYSGMAAIALVTAGSIRAVTENRAPARRAAATRGVAVERRSPPAAAPARRAPQRAGGRDRVGDQPGRAAGGVRRPLAQPGRGDHRRRRSGWTRSRAARSGPSPRCSRSRRPAWRSRRPGPHRVVHVDERHRRRPPAAAGTAPARFARNRAATASSCRTCPKRERPQERPQRRGRPHPGEQPAHRRRAAAGPCRRSCPRRRPSPRPAPPPSPRPRRPARRAPSDCSPASRPARPAPPAPAPGPARQPTPGSAHRTAPTAPERHERVAPARCPS